MNAIAQISDERVQPRPIGVRHHPCCDHYDALLRRLQAAHNGSPAPRIIGVTSCSRGAGVSTIAANLAIRAADQATGPVLLVDANRRHPALQQLLNIPAGRGLSEALSGALPQDCITASRIDGLSIMQAGDTKAAAAVAGPAMVEKCFEDLQSAYPLVIVDLPPVDDLSPCWDLIGQLDGVVLVIEAEKTRSAPAQRVLKQLAEAGSHVLGVVFNKRRTYLPKWLYRLL